MKDISEGLVPIVQASPQSVGRVEVLSQRINPAGFNVNLQHGHRLFDTKLFHYLKENLCM